MNRPHTTLIGIGCALALLLTGCTATEDAPPQDPQDLSDVSIDDYGSVTAKLDLDRGTASLPLDPYQSLTPELNSLLLQAETGVANQCLAQHGIGKITSQPPSPSIDQGAYRRYFPWNLDTAQRFGLGLDPAGKGIFTDPQGDPQTIDDCRAEGLTAILPFTGEGGGEGKETGPGIDVKIRTAAESLVEKNPAYISAIKELDGCITGHGQKTDGHGILAPEYGDRPLDQQIPAAVIAVNCAIDSGTVQKVYDLQARYESAIMPRYEAQLGAVREKTASAATTLKKMIADADAGTYTPPTP